MKWKLVRKFSPKKKFGTVQRQTPPIQYHGSASAIERTRHLLFMFTILIHRTIHSP